MLETWAAIILAGGRGSRLDGVDKAGIEIAGRTMLEWSLDACIDASEVVVVGEHVPTDRPVTFTRESPRFGGPVAGLLTGVDALLRRPAYVGVLAVDMPHLTMGTMRRLTDAAESAGGDGAALVDPTGRRQLAMVLRRDRLLEVRPSYEAQHSMALHALLSPLSLADVPAVGDEHRDIDTWTDLRDLDEA
ncbi:molybdenum cofactor guanylyltransferase [Nocardioides sp. Kera G14]|uniref:molybdenum cofactor guanylyltransferase n=1 Tax=Nocardioides sp. Kera G14 TaxID=2884264 RepID=UPI001D0F98E8|nr:NTP transferase domain-containing protein [Nocardioides sp. Kera G14]UDY23342.1 NTP transferase domain-containing protein [Nocardioides sp. Kera G14]